eukprot:6187391-Pleurochrysis_carterae.AAC.1
MKLFVEDDGVQLVLVDVQNVLALALQFEEFGTALCRCSQNALLHGQNSGCQMPVAPLLLGAVVVEVLLVVEVLPYGRYSNGQETQVQGTQQILRQADQDNVTDLLICAWLKSVAFGLCGSAIDTDHNLDEPVVCKASSNVHEHVGQIKGKAVRNQVIPGLFRDGS